MKLNIPTVHFYFSEWHISIVGIVYSYFIVNLNDVPVCALNINSIDVQVLPYVVVGLLPFIA